jgi:hypothetical protein
MGPHAGRAGSKRRIVADHSRKPMILPVDLRPLFRVSFRAHGGHSSVGRAPDCGFGCRGFDPRWSPFLFQLRLLSKRCFDVFATGCGCRESRRDWRLTGAWQDWVPPRFLHACDASRYAADMRFIAIQTDPVWHDVVANRQRISRRIDELDAEPGDYLVLPEMCETAWTTDIAALSLAENSVDWFSAIARARSLAAGGLRRASRRRQILE